MVEKIKIFFVVNSLDLGGAEAVVLNLAKNIDKNKFNVEIIYFNKGDKKIKSNNFILYNQLESINFYVVQAEKIFSREAFFVLWNYFKNNRPDIVHCHLPASSILGVLAAKLAGVKNIVVHEHNTHNFYSWKIKLALRFIKPLVNFYICYSEAVQKEIFGRVNILDTSVMDLSYVDYTIHNGVDCESIAKQVSLVDRLRERQKFGLKQEDLLVISVSRLVDWKGQDILIKSFPNVIKNFPTAKLLIVGKGIQDVYLKNLSQSLGIEKNVIFLGERSDILNLLAMSDIFSFVLNYPRNFQSEAIGVAALEAMAVGLPVLLASYSSIPCFMENNKNVILVPPGNVLELAEAIKKLLHSSEKCEYIVANAKIVLQNYYDWKKIILVYQNFYELMLSH